MSTVADMLTAALQHYGMARPEGASASVPVPDEQVQGIVTVIRQLVAAGRTSNVIVPLVPDLWAEQPCIESVPVVGPDGQPLLGADGQPVQKRQIRADAVLVCKPWAPKGNPAQGYADAARRVLCGARGGDDTVVWVSQYTDLWPLTAEQQAAYAAAVAAAPAGQKVKKPARKIRGAGLELRARIPASAENIPPQYAHLVG